jgi:NADPH:quinone reductase-like Zn-dependent oxidoreductase
MQVVDPHVRAERRPVEAVRTVTVLGATGSVGMSTVDLLKRGNGHYRIDPSA